jgi:hypothetical protein
LRLPGRRCTRNRRNQLERRTAHIHPMPTNLVERCTEANTRGADFPTVWHTVLKLHPLVAGIPRQRMAGAKSVLEIPLITGQCIRYDGDLRRFSLESA